MARMFPTLPAEESPGSERKIYYQLRDTLPNEYIIFHSLPYLARQKNAPLVEGEVDFLLIHPKRGLLVLEVKGGKEIHYDAQKRKWSSLDFDDTLHNIKDPFEQGRKNLHNIIKKIQGRQIFGSHDAPLPFVYGYAVVFPDAIKPSSGFPTHVISEILIDAASVLKLNSAIDRVLSYWAREGSGKGEIQPDDYKRIIQEVFLPEFKLARPFHVQLRDERETLVRLTHRQFEILNTFLQVNKKALIQGYAGTGKTTIALLKARELAKEGKNVLFLCYNELLASYLQNQVQDLPSIIIRTYHSFAKFIIEKHSSYIWPKHPAKKFWEEVVPTQLFDTIAKQNIVYDVIIVDEAQDFRLNWWQSIELMVQKKSCFYVFYDPYQNIYQTQSELPDLPTTLPLIENCRTTQNINKKICAFGSLDIKDSGYNPPGIDVEECVYRDEQEFRTLISKKVKYLKKDLHLNSGSILLLSPSSYQNSMFGSNPILEGYSVLEYKHDKPKDNEIYYESIYAFKGLDADAVIVFGTPSDITEHQNDLLYVASSRARHILILLIHIPEPPRSL